METTTTLVNYGRRRGDLKREEIEMLLSVVDTLTRPINSRQAIEAVRSQIGRRELTSSAKERVAVAERNEKSDRLVHWVHRWSFATFIVLSSLSAIVLCGLVIFVKLGLIPFPVLPQ